MAIPSSSSSSSQSPSICQSQNQILDRSQSAPASMQQAPAPPDLPQLLTTEKDASPPLSDHLHPPPPKSQSDPPPVPSPSSDMFHRCTPPANVSDESQISSGGASPETGGGNVESGEVESTSFQTRGEECSPEQPMDQQVSESDAADTIEAHSVEMECRTPANEREQPDGDRCSSSDNIPSLAVALKELHELLVQSHNSSVSCSTSHLHGQVLDKPSPEPSTPTAEHTLSAPSTANAAGAEKSDAKANCAAAVSDGESSKRPNLSVHVERLHEAEAREGLGPPPCPDSSEDKQDKKETSGSIVSKLELEVSPGPTVVPDFREPPEGQHGRGVADGQASGRNTPNTLQSERAFPGPASAAVSPAEEVSSTSPPSDLLLSQAPPPSSPAPPPPSPHAFIEQFPAEHIQRIQAAGFSAREAVEALEQAHGVVEIALLALLARSITVPT